MAPSTCLSAAVIVSVLWVLTAADGNALFLRVKRSDDTSVASLQALVQQQASAIQALQSQQAATLNELAQLRTSFQTQQAATISELAPLRTSLQTQQAATLSELAQLRTSLQTQQTATVNQLQTHSGQIASLLDKQSKQGES